MDYEVKGAIMFHIPLEGRSADIGAPRDRTMPGDRQRL
jgi:hypothetical protein